MLVTGTCMDKEDNKYTQTDLDINNRKQIVTMTNNSRKHVKNLHSWKKFSNIAIGRAQDKIHNISLYFLEKN